jgi:uncharacterized protein (DUF58 family)
MDYGAPSKYDYARKVVAALGYVALSNLDSIAILPFGRELLPEFPLARGKTQILKIFEFLENLEVAEQTDMNRALSAFVARKRPKGLVVVVSDFWDEAGYERALKLAYTAGYDLSAVCLHHEYEAHPKWRGTVMLTDTESGRRQQISINARSLRKYAREYDAYLERLRTVCHSLHCHYLYAQTRIAFEDLILNVFREGQFIK